MEESPTTMQKKYEALFSQLLLLNTDANNTGLRNEELSHQLQDQIYRTFIIDIVKGNFKNTIEIKLIAMLMKQYVVDYDTGRLYS